MTNAVSFALTGVIIGTLTGIIQRSLMRQNADAIAILIFNQLVSCLVLLSFFGLPDFSSFTYNKFFLLLLSGIFWGIKGWAFLKALKYLELNTSAIIGKLRFITLTLVGIVVFNEKMTLAGFLGVILILASVLSSCRLSGKIANNKGVIYQVLGVISYTAAVTIEKSLASTTEILSISIIGFLFPGLIVLALYPRRARLIPGEISSSKGLLLLLPIGYAGASFTMIKALQLGTLSAGIAIYQMDMLLVFFFGIIFLKETSDLIKKSIRSSLCIAGALMVCFA